jgi:flagellin
MSSILTNSTALVALQTLKSVNKGLGKVQNEISTGMKVATAKDNSSAWAIASTMNSDVGSLKKLGESLTSASAMVGVARTATEQVADLLRQVQEKVVQAQNPEADLVKLHADIVALAETMGSIADSAQYNGINLVDGVGGAQTVTVSITRSAAGAVGSQTFSTGASDLATVATTIAGLIPDRIAGPPAGIGHPDALDVVDTQLDTVNTAAATFGAAQIRIDGQAAFLTKQMDALKEGVGALVDADMEEASARLQALQVQQQLGIQALSIANQAPQSVLSLFR